MSFVSQLPIQVSGIRVRVTESLSQGCGFTSNRDVTVSPGDRSGRTGRGGTGRYTCTDTVTVTGVP
eukprot:1429248-Rhodomonas_salina.2